MTQEWSTPFFIRRSFFQNYEENWSTILKTGVLAEPWSSETRFSRVDYRDVAEVAAIALTNDHLLDGTFELCAEGHFDRHDVAALISDVLGKEIRAQKLDPASLGAKAEPMRPMFDRYDRLGLLGTRSHFGRSCVESPER